MRAEKGTGQGDNEWVIERLYSWGAWAARGNRGNGYGESCLTLEEIRSMPVRAYIPVSDPECDRTHEELRKLPLEWFQLAGLIYIKQWPVHLAAQELGMSRAKGYRVQSLVVKGLEFLLRNPGLKAPPLHRLLKT